MKPDNDIAVRSSIGAWWSAWITAGIFVIAWQTLENNRRNTANTRKMLSELESINNKLSDLG